MNNEDKFKNVTKAEMAHFAEATIECLEYGRVYDLIGAWKYLQRGMPPEMQLSKLDLYIKAFTGEIKSFIRKPPVFLFLRSDLKAYKKSLKGASGKG